MRWKLCALVFGVTCLASCAGRQERFDEIYDKGNQPSYQHTGEKEEFILYIPPKKPNKNFFLLRQELDF